MQLSTITMTEEAVGPIDNIAPLSVPAVRAVDVLNDEGGRIEVTWTLSPSDRILQDVIAEATGPAAVQPVAGVLWLFHPSPRCGRRGIRQGR